MSDKKHPLEPKDGYERVEDLVYTGTKAILGPAGDLFSYIFTPPWEDRRDAWIKSIEDGLKDLQEKVQGFDMEQLPKNQLFVSVVSQATKAALLTHEKEKLQALRNACLNAAMPNSAYQDLQLIFINLLDSMTQSHIRMLIFMSAPREHLKGQVSDQEGLRGGPLYPYIEKTFPEMNRQFYQLIIDDLKSKGLLDSSIVDTERDKPFRSRTTKLGWDLVQFIKSPLKED